MCLLDAASQHGFNERIETAALLGSVVLTG